jgi:hypothetical protein
MEYAIGIVLAFGVAVFAALVGMDRQRAFYPTLLIVVASYYVLFAVMGASGETIGLEIAVAALFLLVAAIGFNRNLWLVAAALAGHGVFDLIHHRFITNPGVPHWWPGFCMSFDVVAGIWFAILLRRRHAIS